MFVSSKPGFERDWCAANVCWWMLNENPEETMDLLLILSSCYPDEVFTISR